MLILIEEKKKFFKELKPGSIFKITADEGEIERNDLYMKILVRSNGENVVDDSFKALSLEDAMTYDIPPETEITEFENSTFKIEVTY